MVLVTAANIYNCMYTVTTKLSYVDTRDVGEVCAKENVTRILTDKDNFKWI
ncbi:MAG: hypothetical protein LUD01_03140 [Clostridiales bacterium]|nr:hypothetical protein [Clostridiales bacterium]